MKLLAALAMAFSILWWGTTTPQAHSMNQTLAVGAAQVPCLGPGIAGRHPLAQIRDQIVAGDLENAVAELETFLSSLDGWLLLPPSGATTTSGWQSVLPVTRVLRDWLDSLPEGAAALPLDRLVPSRSAQKRASLTKLSPTDPVYWHPEALPWAQERFERALEAHHLEEALRLLSSPQTVACAPELRGFLRSQLVPSGPAAAHSAAAPHQLGDYVLPEQLQLRYQIAIDVGHVKPTPQHPEGLRGRVRTRVGPTSLITPLVTPETAVFVAGPKALGVSLAPSPRLQWELEVHPKGAAGAALLHRTTSPTTVGSWLALPSRTASGQDPGRIGASHRDSVGWETWRLFETKPGLPPQPLAHPAAEFLARHSAHETVIAPPLLVRDQIFLLTVRGWNELRIQLHAGNVLSGNTLWSRRLGSVDRPWHSVNDLRTLLPSGQLLSFAGEIIAVPGTGWVSRIDAVSGTHVAAFFYPTLTWEELPYQPVLTVDRTRFRELPVPRVRLCHSWIASSDAANAFGGAAHLIALPSDSESVFSLNLENWRLSWAHGPVGRGASMLGAIDGELLLVDPEVPCGSQQLTVRRLDETTGRVLAHHDLEIVAPEDQPRATQEQDRDAPLIVGLPTVTQSALWVPTAWGIQSWNWDSLGGGVNAPNTFLVWPAGSQGGTLVPLPDGRILTVSSGFVGQGTPAMIEVFGDPVPETGTEATPK